MNIRSTVVETIRSTALQMSNHENRELGDNFRLNWKQKQ